MGISVTAVEVVMCAFCEDEGVQRAAQYMGDKSRNVPAMCFDHRWGRKPKGAAEPGLDRREKPRTNGAFTQVEDAAHAVARKAEEGDKCRSCGGPLRRKKRKHEFCSRCQMNGEMRKFVKREQALRASVAGGTIVDPAALRKFVGEAARRPASPAGGAIGPEAPPSVRPAGDSFKGIALGMKFRVASHDEYLAGHERAPQPEYADLATAVELLAMGEAPERLLLEVSAEHGSENKIKRLRERVARGLRRYCKEQRKAWRPVVRQHSKEKHLAIWREPQVKGGR